jgi:hypothetical protein
VNNLAITYKNLPRSIICIHPVGLTWITGSWPFEPPKSASSQSAAYCFRNDPMKTGAPGRWHLKTGFTTAALAKRLFNCL